MSTHQPDKSMKESAERLNGLLDSLVASNKMPMSAVVAKILDEAINVTSPPQKHSESDRRNLILRGRLANILPIINGLLSSGHYTSNDPDDGVGFLFVDDFGKDWKENGFSRRCSYRVIEDSLSLMNSLQKNLREQLENESEDTP